MADKIAKVRMIDNMFEEAVKLIQKEEEVPDEMLVLMAQWMSRALNNRASQIANKIEHDYPRWTPVPEDKLAPLWKIKQTKDAIDEFVETYAGWSDKE